MITFYPRDIGIWGDNFDFHPVITLLPKAKNNHKVFFGRQELIDFLKENGAELNDGSHPLQFIKAIDAKYVVFCKHEQTEQLCLGYFIDDFR